MRESPTFAILEAAAKGFCATAVMLDEALRSTIPAGMSYKGIRSSRSERESREERFAETDRAIEARMRHTVAGALYRLKRDGFIEAKTRKGVAGFILSKMGRNELERRLSLPPETQYETKHDGIVKIIIYDIPERLKGKREWLRSALRTLGMRLLQKSVWIGNMKIPPAFLEDLAAMHLVDHVEIFAISKTGTIKKIE